MEDNSGLFLDTVRKLWAACGDRQSWKSGYTERLAKNLLAISPDFPGFNEGMAQAAFNNYARRRLFLALEHERM